MNLPIATGPARILLCADSEDGLRPLLEQAGYQIGVQPLSHEPQDLSSFTLLLVEGTGRSTQARSACERLRRSVADGFLPILLITDDATPEARLVSAQSGADAYLLRPFVPAELVASVHGLVRLKHRHDALATQAADARRTNQQLQSASRQLDRELELARRIHQSFLPQRLPEVPQVRFAVHYQPCGQVGGDFYDVFRLDERHLGFYIADAMGHGVPASLLTIFVKKGVRAKEIFGKQYRLVPPNEVLQRLNHEMIEHALSENPFITMVYVLLDFQKGTLQFARAGHPYPLYLPHDGPPQLWQTEGSLLGVFDTPFPAQTHQLRPGDKLLLYTDGMDAARFADRPPGAASLLAAAERYRDLNIDDLIARLRAELFSDTTLNDDLTLLGIEMTKGTGP